MEDAWSLRGVGGLGSHPVSVVIVSVIVPMFVVESTRASSVFRTRGVVDRSSGDFNSSCTGVAPASMVFCEADPFSVTSMIVPPSSTWYQVFGDDL